MADTLQTIVGLDVGTVRVGVAVANTIARMARPLTTLDTMQFDMQFADILKTESPTIIVVGLPRNLQGDATPQTAYVEQFAKEHLQNISATIVWQDEALTSVKAETELAARKKSYVKADIDALAASYIAQDYLDTLPSASRINA